MNFLVIGLGNIGAEYDFTRHNIGFEVLDVLAKEKELSFTHERLAFKSLFRFKGRNFHLIKPTTYMNLSGRAVRYWMDRLKIKRENILVILDDLALPFGKLRLKGKGSDGGHNGLKDIDAALNTNQYARLRFGIGSDFSSGRQTNYVLGKWSAEEEKELAKPINKSIEIIKAFGTVGLVKAMNLYN